MAAIEFFAHPGHRLAEHHENTEYTCGACKTTGDGARYRCTDKSCHFDLHHYCATCPMELSSFMHPAHHLVFGLHNEEVSCDVCAELMDGLFYRCKDCNFNVHPICTLLPEKVPHVAHSKHLLTLQKAVPGACIACAEECPSWRYRCGLGGACIIDIHIGCVLDPYSSPNTQPPPNQNHRPPQTRDIAYQKPTPPQFPPQPPLHGGYGHDNPHALPPQPHHYYNNNPPPHPYNNQGYPNPSAPHFPPQQPNPSVYFYDHKANAPPPPPQMHHGYYQNPPYPPPYYGYHGHNQPHYYHPQPPPYNHAHSFAKPPPQNGFLGQTPEPPPCFEAGIAYGVPSGPSGNKVDSELKPGKEDGPKKGKKCKMMCAIVGRLAAGVIAGVIFGFVPIGF